MSSKRKPIPTFQNEAEERDFWERHDSADYVDWDMAMPACFPISNHPRRQPLMKKRVARQRSARPLVT